MTGTTRIAAIGECMIELRDMGAAGLTMGFGGDSLNTAVYAARLGAGAGLSVDYLTALGNDPYSEQMLAFWRREGIGTALVRRLPDRLPGLYVIRTDDAGERSFYYWRSAAAARDRLLGNDGSRMIDALPDYDLIYLSGVTLSILDAASRARLLDGLGAARAAGAKIAFDSNYRRRGWADAGTARAAMEALLRCTDIALPSHEDGQALHGDGDLEQGAARMAGLGVPEVCITDGARGCLILREGHSHYEPVPAPVQAVDTTAAGDAFNAAYLVARLHGADAPAAARKAHLLAREVVRHHGAVIPLDAMPKRQL